MCGIFGYVGTGFSPDLLMDGIRRLEYRGYDSWGIALCGADGPRNPAKSVTVE